jgi:hypothetical protein
LVPVDVLVNLEDEPATVFVVDVLPGEVDVLAEVVQGITVTAAAVDVEPEVSRMTDGSSNFIGCHCMTTSM